MREDASNVLIVTSRLSARIYVTNWLMVNLTRNFGFAALESAARKLQKITMVITQCTNMNMAARIQRTITYAATTAKMIGKKASVTLLLMTVAVATTTIAANVGKISDMEMKKDVSIALIAVSRHTAKICATNRHTVTLTRNFGFGALEGAARKLYTIITREVLMIIY